MRKVLLATFLTLLTVVTAFGQSTDAKCPEITVAGPAGLTLAGDVMVFRADIKALDSSSSISYEWKITAGIITDGQGTTQITVRTNPDEAGSTITATVNIKGLAEKCSVIASEVGHVVPRLDCGLREEYGYIPWLDERARLDNLLIQLNNNPNARGFVYILIVPGETVANTKKHISKIATFIKRRYKDFDLGRLTFGIHKGQDRHATIFYIVPAGAEMPKCDADCTFVNGKDLYP